MTIGSLFSIQDYDNFLEEEKITSNITSRRSSVSSLPVFNMQKVNTCLAHLNSFDFNIFELDEYLDKKTVLYMGLETFINYGFFEKQIIKEEKFNNFMKKIISGYNRNVAYHNDLHAGDVLQTTYVMLNKGRIIKELILKDIDILATLLAAICHDFKHPGKNNIYQINAQTEISLTYNGIFLFILYY